MDRRGLNQLLLCGLAADHVRLEISPTEFSRKKRKRKNERQKKPSTTHDVAILCAVNFPLILTVLLVVTEQIFAEEHLRPNHWHVPLPDVLDLTSFIPCDIREEIIRKL